MANAVYPKSKKAAWSGGANVNMLTATLKLVLIDTGAYTYSATHEFLTDIPAGARLSTTGALTGKTVSDLGALDFDNTTFVSVTSTSAEGVVLFVDTGSAATSRLIVYKDTGITGLPVTPAGASYNYIVDGAGFVVF
jgi:hypothetical protein